MIQENELIIVLVGTGGLIFILLNLKVLARSVPSWPWLFAAFLSLYSGWIVGVLEGLIFPTALNLLEHVAYMLSSILAAAWALRTMVFEKEKGP